MKPLIVLLSVFVIFMVGTRLAHKRFMPTFSARLAMAAMLFFTAIGHFIYVEGMSMMVPPAIPYKKEIIYTTGVLEILFAILLSIRTNHKVVGWWLIIFFVCVLPGNIYAAIHHVDYQNASYTGPGPKYLLFRIPLQLVFIAWVYFSTIRTGNKAV